MATASSGLAVAFSAAGACTVVSGTVHIVPTGSCTITASQAGDDNWNPAPDVQSVVRHREGEDGHGYTGFTGDVLNGTTTRSPARCGPRRSGDRRPDADAHARSGAARAAVPRDDRRDRCSELQRDRQPDTGSEARLGELRGRQPVPSVGFGRRDGKRVHRELAHAGRARTAAGAGAGASKQDGDKLDDAVKKLTDALDPSLWVDGNRVTASMAIVSSIARAMQSAS